MELYAVLKEIHALIVKYRKEHGIAVGEFATKAGLKKNSLAVIEEETYTKKGKLSTIDLATLVKILIQYDELRILLADYLRGNTDKNITYEPKKIGSLNNDILLKNALAAILDKDNKIIELEAKLKKATGSGKAKTCEGHEVITHAPSI